MISTMRLRSLPKVIACAEKIVDTSLGTYFARNKTIRELYELAKSGLGIDPLRDFSAIAREELQAFAST